MRIRALGNPPPSWLWVAVIVGAGVGAHAAAWSAPFIFDDILCIKDNSSILSLSRWRDVLWPPVDGSGVSGRPLVNLSLALNYAWGEFDPRGYHVFNIAAHCGVAGLVFALVARCLGRALVGQADCERRSAWLGFVVALLWVTHPLQTESVACVIQRTEVLGALFYLLTLWAFVRSLDSAKPIVWQVIAVAACLAGMGTKEIVFTAPFVAFLIDRAWWAGSWREAWRRRWPIYVALMATWLLLAWIVLQMGGTRGGAAGFGTGAVTWWAYFFRQWSAVTTYLKLSLWPYPLVLDYGCDVVWEIRSVALQGALLLLLGVVTAAGAIRNRGWAVPAAAFFLILGPSSSIMPLPAQTMAEHRMYLPLAGGLVLLVLAGWRVGGSRGLVVLLAAGGAWSVVCAQRSADFKSPTLIWRQAVQARPANLRAHFHLAETCFDEGRWDEAESYYRAVLVVFPDLAGAWSGLGNVAYRRRDFPEAIRCYERAIALDPKSYDAMSNLGASLFALGRRDEGLARLRTLVALAPQFANGHFHLGTALLLSGQLGAARSAYEAALRLSPTLAEAHHNLGVVFLQSGDAPAAERAFREALRLRPDYPDAIQNLALARSQRTSAR